MNSENKNNEEFLQSIYAAFKKAGVKLEDVVDFLPTVSFDNYLANCKIQNGYLRFTRDRGHLYIEQKKFSCFSWRFKDILESNLAPPDWFKGDHKSFFRLVDEMKALGKEK